MSNLRIPLLEALQIPTPELSAQRAIAHILGTLDDKIELNRRTNQTLEAMARALFKSWFVDFDPVRAKAAGRLPAGMDAETAALFPSEFVESEIGEIPKGWTVGTLGGVLRQRVDRCRPSASTATRPYVPIECIAARSIYLAQSKSGSEAQSSLTRFHSGDVLFGAMRPYFHKVCIAPFEGTTRTTVFVLTPTSLRDLAYAVLLASDADTIDFATRHSAGSTIPYAVWTGSLEEMPIRLPPESLRSAFQRTTAPLLGALTSPTNECTVLAAIRDALLPRLVSGELPIPNAERIVETAT